MARRREACDASPNTDNAVVVGLGHTGWLVTSAALILFLCFAVLASGPQIDLKVLATGLVAGILLEVTIIHARLVPAAISLFGKWNWWLPVGAAKLPT